MIMLPGYYKLVGVVTLAFPLSACTLDGGQHDDDVGSQNCLSQSNGEGHIDDVFYIWESMFGEFANKPGVVARTSIGSYENVMYVFTDDYTINDLLVDVAEHNIDSQNQIQVFFTNSSTVTEPRTGRELQYNWGIAVHDAAIFDENSVDPEWEARIHIDEDSFDLEEIQIPFGLDVKYSSKLTYMLDFHRSRIVEDGVDPGTPTTAEMVWPERGRFID